MKATDRKPQIYAILSVFESGLSEGDPSACVILGDGAGISYGIHQATDRSGALDAIVLRYLDLVGGHAELARWLPYLAESWSTRQDPDDPDCETVEFMALLVRLGRGSIMRRAQEDVFDRDYWRPAVKRHKEMRLTTPLALCILYDTCIQSGPRGVERIRRRFAEVPPSQGGSEQAWCRAYVSARHAWLSGHSNAAVRTSSYRTLALLDLIGAGAWDLEPSFIVRGQVIR